MCNRCIDRTIAYAEEAAADGSAAELLAAQGLNLSLADRVFKQSELLSRKAERPAVSLTETDHYPEG